MSESERVVVYEKEGLSWAPCSEALPLGQTPCGPQVDVEHIRRNGRPSLRIKLIDGPHLLCLVEIAEKAWRKAMGGYRVGVYCQFSATVEEMREGLKTAEGEGDG